MKLKVWKRSAVLKVWRIFVVVARGHGVVFKWRRKNGSWTGPSVV